MTITSKCIHPDGTIYEAIAPYRIVRLSLGLYEVPVKDGKAGVRITRPDGVKIFRPNEYYE